MTTRMLLTCSFSGSITGKNGRSASTTAIFSEDKIYRYRLTRDLSDDLLTGTARKRLLFIMLNPSTATELKDDPTLRKIQGFAWSWGFNELMIGNAFAYRSPYPDVMKKYRHPIGPDNDVHLAAMAQDADQVIIAWGRDGRHLCRERAILRLLDSNGIEPYCLGQNDDGTPRHPLFLKNSTKPILFTP